MKLLESSHSLSSSRVTFPEWDPQASKLPESWTFKQLRASSQTWTHSYINHYFNLWSYYIQFNGHMCLAWLKK